MNMLIIRDLPDTWQGRAPRCAVCGKPVYTVYHCQGCSDMFLCGKGCHRIFHAVHRHVPEQNERAKEKGLEATLSVTAFLGTLQYFHGQCAYCQSAAYESIDHYIPVMRGGGTTRRNCFPSCKYCNLKKGVFSGEHLRYVFDDDAYERIQDFLAIM